MCIRNYAGQNAIDVRKTQELRMLSSELPIATVVYTPYTTPTMRIEHISTVAPSARCEECEKKILETTYIININQSYKDVSQHGTQLLALIKFQLARAVCSRFRRSATMLAVLYRSIAYNIPEFRGCGRGRALPRTEYPLGSNRTGHCGRLARFSAVSSPRSLRSPRVPTSRSPQVSRTHANLSNHGQGQGS